MDDSEYPGVVRAAMADLNQQFSYPAEIDATLAGVTAASILLIAGVDSADVLLIGGSDQFRSLAQTSPLAVELDAAQQRFGGGPCVDAAIGDPMVCCNDLRADSR